MAPRSAKSRCRRPSCTLYSLILRSVTLLEELFVGRFAPFLWQFLLARDCLFFYFLAHGGTSAPVQCLVVCTVMAMTPLERARKGPLEQASLQVTEDPAPPEAPWGFRSRARLRPLPRPHDPRSVILPAVVVFLAPPVQVVFPADRPCWPDH